MFLGMSSLGRLGACSPVVGGGLGVLIPDRTNYTRGQYLGYLNPYSTESGGANHGLVHGVDYENNLKVYPASFPNRSKIFWRWPTNLNGAVVGYLQLTFGNYDGGVPAVSVPPQRVGALSTFTETIDYTMAGDVADATILNEFYLTTSAGDLGTKTFEIAHVLHQSVQAKAWFDTCAVIGVYTDPQGRSWQALNCGNNPAGALYVVFRPVSGDFITGIIDKLAALVWLEGQGLISFLLWVNGTALGIEPHQGSGELDVAIYRVDFRSEGTILRRNHSGTATLFRVADVPPLTLVRNSSGTVTVS